MYQLQEWSTNYETNCRGGAIKSYLHFYHFAGELKFEGNCLCSYDFLCKPVKIICTYAFSFFNFTKSIYFCGIVFLIKTCRIFGHFRFGKNLISHNKIRAKIPRKLYDFLHKPIKINGCYNFCFLWFYKKYSFFLMKMCITVCHFRFPKWCTKSNCTSPAKWMKSGETYSRILCWAMETGWSVMSISYTLYLIPWILIFCLLWSWSCYGE